MGKLMKMESGKKPENIFPSHKEAAPVKFTNNQGNIITGYEAIRNFALLAIMKWLRKHAISPQLKELERLKNLWKNGD